MERSRLFNHYVVDVIPWKQSKVMIFQCRVFKLITLTHRELQVVKIHAKIQLIFLSLSLL